ncbi:dienelactone hydrolase family protein [Actinomadura barringtoniae]|uniref:Dienelactone hydrolase family protein n=1 Tax=Actinomadura barringtoniae TaxID=1427535 RepID=A0A939PG38_9ACTN|nr:dienelactone hydrolase family protein [Actinomadura barringtoniae]MBO2447871.1 dienelactone hydrolase family protein [Actinomadura barringtoniae]
MKVRSLWWAARTGGEPPFDTAHLKVYYPAKAEHTDAERLTGVLPADGEHAPYPVVVFCSGINVGQDAYRWLAAEIASAGFVVVTFDRVAELFGGQVGITPGVDLEAARPETYGQRPTCPTIPAVLNALEEIDLLKGVLDLDRIALGGHSAGGTVVLQSARFFPGVRACFAWGTHTMVATMLGWPAGTVLPAQVDCPVLLGVGGRDGVIMGSSDRYGQQGAAQDPVTRTFQEALSGPDDLLATVPGANHFMIADPVDATAARAFLDLTPESDPGAARRAYADLVVSFLHTHVRGDGASPADAGAPDADPSLIDVRRRPGS